MCRRGTAHSQTEDRDELHRTLPRYRHVMGCSPQDPNALLARSAGCPGNCSRSAIADTPDKIGDVILICNGVSFFYGQLWSFADNRRGVRPTKLDDERHITIAGNRLLRLAQPQSIGSDVANQHLSFLVRRLRDRPSPFRRVSMAHGKLPFPTGKRGLVHDRR